jgi:hypothetical protein
MSIIIRVREIIGERVTYVESFSCNRRMRFEGERRHSSILIKEMKRDYSEIDKCKDIT